MPNDVLRIQPKEAMSKGKTTVFRQKSQVFEMAKGLDKKEAFKRAKKLAIRDFRGFNYNPRTGRAELI